MSKFNFNILLSASVPTDNRDVRFTKIKNAQIQIEEAVIGLTRNIFSAGGKLVFGGHPSISPLIAMVATEYNSITFVDNLNKNVPQEKSIKIFQSKAFEAVIPKELSILYGLAYTEIIWTPAINGEEFNLSIQELTQCHESLELMRREMMKGDIDALVCIGGMEGVESEFKIFRELHPDKPIYLLKSTGGASKILAHEYSSSSFVRILDDIENINNDNRLNNLSEHFEIIPYSFITALIVKEISNKKCDL